MLNFQKNNHLMTWLKNKKIRLCAGIGATIVFISGYAIKSETLTDKRNDDSNVHISYDIDSIKMKSEKIEKNELNNNLTTHYEDLAESAPYIEEPLVFPLSRTNVHSEDANYVQILQFYRKDSNSYRYRNLQGKEFIVIIDGEQLHFIYQVEEGWVGAHSANDKKEFETMIMPLSQYILLNGYKDVVSKDMDLTEIESMINSENIKNDELPKKSL